MLFVQNFLCILFLGWQKLLIISKLQDTFTTFLPPFYDFSTVPFTTFLPPFYDFFTVFG